MPWLRKSGNFRLWLDSFDQKVLVLRLLETLLRWESPHTSRGTLPPETAAVVKRSASLDCVAEPSRFRGDTWFYKFQPTENCMTAWKEPHNWH